MKKIIIAVYDSKAESFSIPSVTDNTATAIRDFQTLVKDGRTIIGQHPEDFELLRLGEYDLCKGSITSVDHVHLAYGSDFVKPKE